MRKNASKSLTLTSALAAGLMVIAPANLALVYVLLSARPHVGPPGTDLSTDLLFVAIGGFPFLATAALLTWTLFRARANPAALDWLIAISAVAFPLLLIFGFWTGLITSMYAPQDGSPAGDALYIYQFTFVGTLLADFAVLVLAMVTFLQKAPRGNR
jgi:hypothetical protein